MIEFSYLLWSKYPSGFSYNAEQSKTQETGRGRNKLLLLPSCERDCAWSNLPREPARHTGARPNTSARDPDVPRPRHRPDNEGCGGGHWTSRACGELEEEEAWGVGVAGQRRGWCAVFGCPPSSSRPCFLVLWWSAPRPQQV